MTPFQKATRESSPPSEGVNKPRRETDGTKATGEAKGTPRGEKSPGDCDSTGVKGNRSVPEQVGKCWEILLQEGKPEGIREAADALEEKS